MAQTFNIICNYFILIVYKIWITKKFPEIRQIFLPKTQRFLSDNYVTL